MFSFRNLLYRHSPPERYQLPRSMPRLDRAMVEAVAKFAERARLKVLPRKEIVSVAWQAIFSRLHTEGILPRPELVIEPSFEDEVPLHFVHFAALLRTPTDGKGAWYFCRGASDDFTEAVSKAVGELLERYPLMIYRRNEMPFLSCADLKKRGGAFFDPQWLAGFSEKQKRDHAEFWFDGESSFYWVQARILGEDAPAYVPAQLVFWNYYHRNDREPFLREPNTSGAGGFFDREGAILSGLYELIQRDAFFVYWLNRIAPPRVDLATVGDEEISRIVSALRASGLTPHVCEVTSDIKIPAFVAILVNEKDHGPAAVVGGGCEPSPQKAVRRALIEAMSMFHWLYHCQRNFKLPDHYAPFSSGVGQFDRLRFWANPEHREHLDWFLEGPVRALAPEALSFGSKKQELAYAAELVNALGKEEYRIYFYESSHPILRELGYHSVKVIVPALIPLYLAEVNAPLGASRLMETPKKLGLGRGNFPFPIPHPFP